VSEILLAIRLGLLNLVEHRQRSALLGGAIAIVTSFFVLLNAMSTGISGALVHSVTTLSSGDINVHGYYKPTPSQSSWLLTDYERVAEVLKRSVPELEVLVARTRGIGTLVSERSSTTLSLIGFDLNHEPKFNTHIDISSGELDALRQPKTLLIFESHARKLNVRVGDSVTISTQTLRGTFNTIDVRVGAIARDVGILSQYSVFMPVEAIDELYQLKANTSSSLQLAIKPEFQGDLPAIAQRLRQSLAAAGYRVMPPDPRNVAFKFQVLSRDAWSGQKLDVTTWRDEFSFMNWTETALRGMSTLLMLILMAIVTTGIMNTLWIAIRERTREIGALRAIGMQRASVARTFLVETTLLGAISSISGVCLGTVAAWGINAAQIQVPTTVQLFLMRDTLVLSVEPMSLLAAVALITLVTGLAALYPSLRAARLKPVDAMSHI
jgi:putative ABC transport system permease protein